MIIHLQFVVWYIYVFAILSKNYAGFRGTSWYSGDSLLNQGKMSPYLDGCPTQRQSFHDIDSIDKFIPVQLVLITLDTGLWENATISSIFAYLIQCLHVRWYSIPKNSALFQTALT